MAQTVIVGAIVAVAAGWTVWNQFLRGWVRRRAAKPGGGCGPDCGCGD
jgi:hypothetical protein